jgi:hypothetical protein
MYPADRLTAAFAQSDLAMRRAPMSALFAALLALALMAPPLHAQDIPEADPADVESPDAIVAAAYDVISGAAGEARDWHRFRSLFRPEARLIPTGRTPEGERRFRVMSVEDYVDFATQAFAEEGFYEREVQATTERYGDIAHVLSTYESLRTPDDAEPFARGINSFQLWHDGARWWIVSIFWHGEHDDAPIPARYGG